MSTWDKRESNEDGSCVAHTRFLKNAARKIVAVETKEGVEVRYDSEGKLDFKKFSSMTEFEKVAYKK